MASRNPCKITFKLRREEDQYTPPQETIDVPSSSSSSSFSSSSSSDSEDEILQTHFHSNQLVLYDPVAAANANANANANASAAVHTNVNLNRPISFPFSHPPRVLPSVGTFTVQCAKCFKWRLIPTKDKYEQIREHILEQPFYCETAREWRPCISCDDPADITQDGSRLWAIDKPNIAQPPPGWQRLLRIRGEGSTKFADVYYEAPTGKKLRSMVEIQKYLFQHPQFLDEGVTMSQFSFQIPRPLQENYVRKRPEYAKKRAAPLIGPADPTRLLENGEEVNPLAWAGPDDSQGLQLCRPASPPPHLKEPLFDPFVRPTKKRSINKNSKEYRGDPNFGTEVEGPGQS